MDIIQPAFPPARYERERNRAERSVLKCVMQQDSPARHAMVLAVAAIRHPPAAAAAAASGVESPAAPSPPPQLLLTDGWYWIAATPSAGGELAQLLAKIRTGHLRVGERLWLRQWLLPPAPLLLNTSPTTEQRFPTTELATIASEAWHVALKPTAAM